MKQRILIGPITALGIAVFAFVFAGCATTVAFRVERPPTIPTLGIQRLSVLPFATSDNSSLQRHAATLLTNESLSRIQAVNRFTLVDSGAILRAQSNNQSAENLADATFSGQILSVVVTDDTRQGTRKDSEGNTYTYTIYTRDVKMTYNYNVKRTRDGTMLGTVNKSGSRSDSNEEKSSLKAAETMVQEIVTSTMSAVARDVAPYTVTEQRSIQKEPSKDKVIKNRAKEAEAMVKLGDYIGARDAFLGIYLDTRSIAAAQNVGLLVEFTEGSEAAVAFMQRVLSETGNYKARDEIARLERAMATAGLLDAYRENQSQRDRVVSLMVEEIYAKLPANAKLAVMNNSQTEKDLAESAAIGIINGLQSKNVTLVDRSNRGIADTEKNYQLSGNVSDNDIVRVGNEAGVSVFALVSVTGSGSSRRLSVRLFDVERNTILYQSPLTDEMNL
jgi:TolB-like protein